MLSFEAFAADCWWIGNANSDPMVKANWWNSVPTMADRALVNDGTSHIMTIPEGANLVCNHFTLGADKSLLDNSVTMNGGTLTTKGDLSIGYYVGSGGTFTLNGGAISVGNALYVGQGDRCVGELKITGGSITVPGDLTLGYEETSKGTLTMTGGKLTLQKDKSLAVGRSGTGVVNISGSSALIDFQWAHVYFGANRDWKALDVGAGEMMLSDGATLKNFAVFSLNGPSSFTCNGGVLELNENRTSAIFTAHGCPVYVGNGGITIITHSTSATAVDMGAPLLAAPGATSGGFCKKGSGAIRLNPGNTYLPGPIDIQEGKVIARAPNALPGYATHDFKLAAGAELELGGAWSVEQVNAIKALPGVKGTVTHNRAIDDDLTIADDLKPADISTDGKIVNPKTGEGALILTGHNDLGGEFVVEDGTLVADFGQGLATTDHLTLGRKDSFSTSGIQANGKFAPASGSVTAAIGTKGGEISFADNANAGFAAVVPTTVNLFGDKRVILPSDLPRMLVFNSANQAEDITFLNPIHLQDNKGLDVGVNAGHVYLAEIDCYKNGAKSTESGTGTLAKKGDGALHMPESSTIYYIYSQGGLLDFPAGGTYNLRTLQSNTKTSVTRFNKGAKLTNNRFDCATESTVLFEEGCQVTTSAGGVFKSSSKTVFSNVTWTVTGGDVVLQKSTAGMEKARLHILGGTFKNTGGGWMQVQDAGELIFDGCEATINPPVIAGRSSAANHAKSKVTICGGAQVTMTQLVAMSGDVEISGEKTLVKATGLYQGENDTASSAGGPGSIVIKNGRVEPSADVRVGYSSGSVGLLRVEGGVLTLASAKSLAVGSAGNGTLEVAGGLVDVSGADGVAVLPTWQAEDANYKKTPGGLIRFLGGEVKARKIYGNATRGKAEVDIDGGKVTFVNATQTTLFSGMTARRVGINGGEIDSGTVNVTMGGALAALTNQTKVVATGAALNTAKALVKSGTSTMTLVGENTYACGTEVKAGTLALQSGASLSNEQFVRLSGGTFDLGGNSQTASALLGTGGTLKNGTLTLTDGIYPGGVGTIGTMTVTVDNAKIVGTFKVDISGETADKLVLNGAADVSGLTIDFGSVKPMAKVLQVVSGTGLTGTDKLTLKNVPRGYTATASANGVRLVRFGFTVTVR